VRSAAYEKAVVMPFATMLVAVALLRSTITVKSNFASAAFDCETTPLPTPKYCAVISEKRARSAASEPVPVVLKMYGVLSALKYTEVATPPIVKTRCERYEKRVSVTSAATPASRLSTLSTYVSVAQLQGKPTGISSPLFGCDTGAFVRRSPGLLF